MRYLLISLSLRNKLQRLRLCIHHQACSFNSPITFIDQRSCYCSTSARPIHIYIYIYTHFSPSVKSLIYFHRFDSSSGKVKNGVALLPRSPYRDAAKKKEKRKKTQKGSNANRVFHEETREERRGEKEQAARNQYRDALRAAESSPGNAIQYLLQASITPLRPPLPPLDRLPLPPSTAAHLHLHPRFSPLDLSQPSTGQTRRRRRRRRRRWW